MFNFHSDFYQASLFSSIFNRYFGEVFGVSNHDGFVMSASPNPGKDKVSILLPNIIAEYQSNDLEPIFLISRMRLYFFKIRKSKNNQFFYSDFYQKIIQNVFNDSFLQCKCIYNYTFDHLSKRTSHHISLTKMDSVMSDLTECNILLKSISVQNYLEFNFNFLDNQFSILIKILDILSKLGGARAILQENAIDLLFHIQLFQKHIFSPLGVSI